MQLRKIIKDKRGASTPLTVALILGLLLLICAMSEFFRLGIIVVGIRDGLQQAAVTVTATNYDDTYNGLREGYSGGYTLSGADWQEKLNYDDVYARLDKLLGTAESNGYHIKPEGNGYEYRLSELAVDIANAPLTPGNADKNLEVDARVTIEIPLSFGWDRLPPLTMQIRTRSAYAPKF